MTRWEFLCRYGDKPDLLRQIFELLDLAFPGMSLSDQERLARPLGCRWEKVSSALRLLGRRAAGFSRGRAGNSSDARRSRAGAPAGFMPSARDPDFRGRGLYKALMSDVMRLVRASLPDRRPDDFTTPSL